MANKNKKSNKFNLFNHLLTNKQEVKQTNNNSLQKRQKEQRSKLAQGFDFGGKTRNRN